MNSVSLKTYVLNVLHGKR